MTVCTVIGARPQFIKAAVVSRALQKHGVEEVLVHTGQHYDDDMSRVFFEDLGIPAPTVNLQVGSGTHGYQTGEIMAKLEDYLSGLRSLDLLLIYGDTNSTLAGAITAAKMHIPVAHVEAGLRSHNRAMPEEINRIVADRLSDLLFCPTMTAVENLSGEGVTEGVVLTGDVMLEATQFFAGKAAAVAPLRSVTSHESKAYYLATIHRAENADRPDRLSDILEGFSRLDRPVLLPLHPRTRKRVRVADLPENLDVIAPVGYLQMLTLITHAARVLTDSGGVQKEAYWIGVPCSTLRQETEWVETLAGGWNEVVGSNPDAIERSVRRMPSEARGRFGEAPEGTPSEIVVSCLSGRTPRGADA